MGAGSWFKKVKGSSTSVKSSGFRWKKKSRKDASTFTKSATGGEHGVLGMPPVEDVAATRIQTAFRAYLARKSLQRLKGTARLQTVTQKYPVRKQAKTALFYLHTWSKTQAEIRARRLCMVTEGRRKQKKLENKLKLEAKLHDLEVEWSDGSETMEETLSRIHQREEAAVKRERTMAYAFSHQWRANSNPFGHSSYELGKADWGWSWKERWIAARPWESRVPSQSVTPKKAQQPKQASKVGKNVNSATPKSTVSVKSSGSSGKPTPKARRKSFPPAEQTNSQSNGSSAGKPTSKAQGSSSPLAEQTNPYKQSNGSSSGKPTPKARRSSFPPAEQTNSDKQSNGRDEQTNPDKQSDGSSSGKPTPKVRRSSFPPAEQRNSNKQSNRRVNPTARRLSFPIAQKKPVSRQETAKPKDESATKEKPVT